LLTDDFNRAKLSASKIQTRLLETRSVTTWENFVEYLGDLGEIMQDISRCAKEVKGIQKSTLVSIAHLDPEDDE
jgi:N-glycosylase/DNA lyase